MPWTLPKCHCTHIACDFTYPKETTATKKKRSCSFYYWRWLRKKIIKQYANKISDIAKNTECWIHIDFIIYSNAANVQTYPSIELGEYSLWHMTFVDCAVALCYSVVVVVVADNRQYLFAQRNTATFYFGSCRHVTVRIYNIETVWWWWRYWERWRRLRWLRLQIDKSITTIFFDSFHFV